VQYKGFPKTVVKPSFLSVKKAVFAPITFTTFSLGETGLPKRVIRDRGRLSQQKWSEVSIIVKIGLETVFWKRLLLAGSKR
jgi:hypothetical protein